MTDPAPDGAADAGSDAAATAGAGRFEGRPAWAAALRQGLADSAAGGARTVFCIDVDFAGWPLSDARVLDAMAAWLRRPQRRWVLIAPAAGFDALARQHPRFEAWRAPRAHAIEAFSPPDGEPMDWPSLLLDDQDRLIRLLDRERWRGSARVDASEARRWRDGLNELLQRCDAAWPVTRLGL